MCCQLPPFPLCHSPLCHTLTASSISINKTMKQGAWQGRRGGDMFGCYVT